MPTPYQAPPAAGAEVYRPVTPLAGRVARQIDARPPTIAALCSIADALNVPVESFLIGEGS